MKKEKWDLLKKEIDEDLNNPNGYFSILAKKKKLQSKRFDRFEKWLETNDFEELFQKLLKRNGDERTDWCHKKGSEKYPTPMMQFVCNYVVERLEVINNELLDGDFSQGTWFFKGYWFQLLCGQGCFWKIYDAELNCLEYV
jgi:hypothetical protein